MSILLIIVGTKIASSRDLDISASCKDNSLVNICEKLVSVRFKLLHEHGSQALQIMHLQFSMPVVN